MFIKYICINLLVELISVRFYFVYGVFFIVVMIVFLSFINLFINELYIKLIMY